MGLFLADAELAPQMFMELIQNMLRDNDVMSRKSVY
jgi:hypothetical protein